MAAVKADALLSGLATLGVFNLEVIKHGTSVFVHAREELLPDFKITKGSQVRGKFDLYVFLCNEKGMLQNIAWVNDCDSMDEPGLVKVLEGGGWKPDLERHLIIVSHRQVATMEKFKGKCRKKHAETGDNPWFILCIDTPIPKVLDLKKPLLDAEVAYAGLKAAQANKEGFTDATIDLLMKKIFVPFSGDDASQWPRGMLIYGPPGAGKSFLIDIVLECYPDKVKAIYNDSAGKLLAGGKVGDAEENIRKTANLCKDGDNYNKLCIMFVDEFETIAGKRHEAKQDYMRNVTNQLMTIISKAKEYPNLYVIGATNYKHTIDEALIRDGRMDFHYFLGPLSAGVRASFFRKRVLRKAECLALLTRYTPLWTAEYVTQLPPEDFWEYFEARTINFTAAQMNGVCNQVELFLKQRTIENAKRVREGKAPIASLSSPYAIYRDVIREYIETNKRNPNLAYNAISTSGPVKSRLGRETALAYDDHLKEILGDLALFPATDGALTGAFGIDLSEENPSLLMELNRGFLTRPQEANGARKLTVESVHSWSADVLSKMLHPLVMHMGYGSVQIVNSHTQMLDEDKGLSNILEGLYEQFEKTEDWCLLVLDLDDIFGAITHMSQVKHQSLSASLSLSRSRECSGLETRETGGRTVLTEQQNLQRQGRIEKSTTVNNSEERTTRKEDTSSVYASRDLTDTRRFADARSQSQKESKSRGWESSMASDGLAEEQSVKSRVRDRVTKTQYGYNYLEDDARTLSAEQARSTSSSIGSTMDHTEFRAESASSSTQRALVGSVSIAVSAVTESATSREDVQKMTNSITQGLRAVAESRQERRTSTDQEVRVTRQRNYLDLISFANEKRRSGTEQDRVHLCFVWRDPFVGELFKLATKWGSLPPRAFRAYGQPSKANEAQGRLLFDKLFMEEHALAVNNMALERVLRLRATHLDALRKPAIQRVFTGLRELSLAPSALEYLGTQEINWDLIIDAACRANIEIISCQKCLLPGSKFPLDAFPKLKMVEAADARMRLSQASAPPMVFTNRAIYSLTLLSAPPAAPVTIRCVALPGGTPQAPIGEVTLERCVARLRELGMVPTPAEGATPPRYLIVLGTGGKWQEAPVAVPSEASVFIAEVNVAQAQPARVLAPAVVNTFYIDQRN